MSDDEQTTVKKNIQAHAEPFDFGIIDELAFDSLDPVQVNSNKVDSNEDETGIFDANNEQDDQDEKAVVGAQVLSKKERKAQKKQEKKIKNQKKEAAADEQGISPIKTDQMQKQSSQQQQSSPKAHDKDQLNQQIGTNLNANQASGAQTANKKKA